jgi:hypothetical protein
VFVVRLRVLVPEIHIHIVYMRWELRLSLM